MRLVREKAAEFGYRPDRIGMIGFSAGGMVTSDALFGPRETRPDFVALIYGIREIKDIPDPAPPLFLAVAADDAGFVSQTVELFNAYRKAKGKAELHVFQSGGPGFVNKGGGADHFMDRIGGMAPGQQASGEVRDSVRTGRVRFYRHMVAHARG